MLNVIILIVIMLIVAAPQIAAKKVLKHLSLEINIFEFSVEIKI